MIQRWRYQPTMRQAVAASSTAWVIKRRHKIGSAPCGGSASVSSTRLSSICHGRWSIRPCAGRKMVEKPHAARIAGMRHLPLYLIHP
jgi:hypothetical protein